MFKVTHDLGQEEDDVTLLGSNVPNNVNLERALLMEQNNLPNLDLGHDDQTSYLHVIMTPGLDQVSVAKHNDVTNMTRLMKFCATDFKCAGIQYMAKGNEELKKELVLIALSA
jgi:hypothetical protein